MKAQNIFLDENTGGKGRYFKARFLQPGLVKYSFGVCLLEKETIDKFIFDFVGCPVIIGHNDVTNENKDELVCGNICHIWYDQQDGWYWGDGIIDNQEALNKIEDGFNVSCQYEITEYSNNTEEKLHNGNPYDKVILNGKPEHLAIVETPRYENAMIAVNALDLTAENEDKWITVKPNGEENKGKHLLVKEGETVGEALLRTYGDKNQQKLFDTKDYKQSKEEISKSREEQKQADKTYKKIKDIEEILKDSASKYTIGEKTLEILKDDLKKLKEKGLEDKKEEKSGGEDFEKETKSTKKDEDKHQKVRDLEDKAYKEFKTMYDNYIDKAGMEGWGGIPASRFDKAKEQFNKKYKEAFEKLESDRFVSFEDFTKRENKAQNSLTDNIKQAINDIKETKMFKNLFKTKENKMDRDELKELFLDCLIELKAKNEEDEAKEEDKKAEEEKEAENKCKNEDVDKRDIIRKIAAIAGLEEDDEKVRTIIKLAEKLAYDKSEAGTADNAKKAKCEDEEDEEEKKEKEEAKNKAKNSIDELKGLISSIGTTKPASKYVTKSDAIALGDKLFG